MPTPQEQTKPDTGRVCPHDDFEQRYGNAEFDFVDQPTVTTLHGDFE